MEYAGKDPDGHPTILYKKRIGNLYHCVEEIRVGRRELALKSLRKFR